MTISATYSTTIPYLRHVKAAMSRSPKPQPYCDPASNSPGFTVASSKVTVSSFTSAQRQDGDNVRI